MGEILYYLLSSTFSICKSYRNSNEICTFAVGGSAACGEKFLLAKAQVEGEVTCVGAACARTDVDTIVFYGHIKRGRNYLLMPNPNYMPAASRGSDQAAN